MRYEHIEVIEAGNIGVQYGFGKHHSPSSNPLFVPHLGRPRRVPSTRCGQLHLPFA